MSFSSAVREALSRLKLYNSNANTGENPRGFGAGGHVSEFPRALKDTALVGDALASEAEATRQAAQTAQTQYTDAQSLVGEARRLAQQSKQDAREAETSAQDAQAAAAGIDKDGGDAATLDGEPKAFFQNAGNLNAGLVPSSRLSGSYDIDITGTADTARNLQRFVSAGTGLSGGGRLTGPVRLTVDFARRSAATAGTGTTTVMSPARTREAIEALAPKVAPGTPAGAIIAFGTSGKPPDGYLDCNGAHVSRTTYKDLYAAIGTTFGRGNGSSTFTLPDLRGEFLRGWDSSRTLGGRQSEAFRSHHHKLLANEVVRHHARLPLESASYIPRRYWVGENDAFTFIATRTSPTLGESSTTGGSETRPRNVAVRFFIKY